MFENALVGIVVLCRDYSQDDGSRILHVFFDELVDWLHVVVGLILCG